MTKVVASLKNIFIYVLILSGCILFIVLKSGVWAMPNIESQYQVSQSLTVNPFSDPDEQYLYQNYFAPLVFGLLSGKSLIFFIVYSAALAVFFLTVFVVWFMNYHGRETALKQYGLLTALTFPVFAIPFYWLGMDGMTLLLIFAILIAVQNSAWKISSALFALLLSFQHFEQAVASFSLLIVTLVIPLVFGNKSHLAYLYKILWVVLWVILGKLIMLVTFHILGIEIPGDRFAYMQKYMAGFLNEWKASWPWMLYAIFGTGWLLLLFHYRTSWPILIAAFLVFISLMFFEDQTRLSAILTFPSLFYWLFSNRQIWANRKAVHLGVILFYVFVPFVYVWGGRPFSSLYKYDVELIKKINPSALKFCGDVNPKTPFRKTNPANDLFFSYSATLDQGIDFSKPGYPYFLCETQGISFQESWGRWTNDRTASLIFRDSLPENFELHLFINSVVRQNLNDPIMVQVRDENHSFVLTKNSPQEVVLNFSHHKFSSRIAIIIPHSASLAELGLGSDSRMVGIGLQRLWIVKQ